MNDIFIISYTCKRLGDYFYLCNIDLQDFIKTLENKIQIHCSHQSCKNDLLHKSLSQYSENYIVTIYAHGNNDKVVDELNNDLITLDDSKKFYKNSIVYSTACKTANNLGLSLVKEGGCKLFFGYSDSSHISTLHKADFVEMDNFTLKLILSENTTDKDYLKAKTEEFFQKKLHESRMQNPIIAPMIMNNKECFQIY
ncbi:hypothetical protein ALC152_08860 [Arcobacter sp. 15-2]|uniref:hypothetical protein n=1 Tax=Arcobacter sp. 15-2 TaxID=3374109 RepID=UPI00399C64A6